MPKLITGAIFLGVLTLALFTFNNTISNQQLASVATAYSELEYQMSAGVESDVLDLSVSAFAIFDVETGEVLLSNNIEEKLPIASITKLITSAVVIDNFDLDQIVTITPTDVATEGRAGKLQSGQTYSYRELLLPLLLESSNDAATVFERVSDEKVVSDMNTLVTDLGATETTFADASGLSAGNVSTAKDLALISTYLYKKQPHIFDITKLSQYVGPYTGWVNNNPVMNKVNYLGGKHGYTHAAGLTIVSIFEEKFGDKSRNIGYVILGSSNLKSDVATLRQFTTESVNLK